MTKVRSADQSIAALYTAAIDPRQWDVALAALMTLADARAANCFLHDARTGAFLEYRFTGYGSDWATGYASHYHRLDLARDVLMREPAGHMYPMHRFLPDRVIARSEYYQDFYIREGLRYSCGGMRLDGDRRMIVAVHRSVGHQPYDAHTTRELQRVLDHLPNVFRLRQTAPPSAASREPLLAAALDALPRAVIVVDDTLRVRYLNTAAIAMLQEAKELRTQADRLVLRVPQVAAQLAQRVKEACLPQPIVEPSPLHALDREQRPTLEIHVVPLKPQLTAPLDRDTRPLAMLLLRRPFQRIARPETEQRPFSLTRAELAVATGIARGQTPAEYAACTGVRISTVRSQIKAIFGKTGVRRIADLVALFGD